MELRVLRYFLAVAREESITRAAESLHVTQPTLSRQLMELEDELGTQLLIRGGRKVTLTDTGMLLRKRAEEMVELMEITERELTKSEETVGGDIYIGGGETQGMRLIARTVKKLETTFPSIRLHLFSGNADDVTERLDKGLLDFGVLIEPADKKKYEFISLPATDIWGVLMRKDSPYAAYAAITPEQLMEMPLLCSRQTLVRNEIAGWTGQGFDALHIAATYNLIYNAALMVEEGVGNALCLDKLVNTACNSALCFRPLAPRLEVGLVLVWKKYQLFSKAAEQFLAVLQTEMLSGEAARETGFL